MSEFDQKPFDSTVSRVSRETGRWAMIVTVNTLFNFGRTMVAPFPPMAWSYHTTEVLETTCR